MPVRKLPDLTPSQVMELQDALLSNADRLLSSALAVLELGNAGLARSLAILGAEESGKAIALHERRVAIAYEPEGTPFVTGHLRQLWASHPAKLKLVHGFLVQERYWFGTEPSDPDLNLASLGAIEAWVSHHNELKQRGFYVDVDPTDGMLTPLGVADTAALTDAIKIVHQIGWQLRLGEHIEAKVQADFARSSPLNNEEYCLHLPASDTDPFDCLGRPGYEAQTREIMRLMADVDE